MRIPMKVTLLFDGFWIEANKKWITPCAGVYCVYACHFNSISNSVRLNCILYIGESDNVNVAVAQNEELERWRSRIEVGEELCYSVAPNENPELRKISVLALVRRNRPLCNALMSDDDEIDSVVVEVSGCGGLLNS